MKSQFTVKKFMSMEMRLMYTSDVAWSCTFEG